MKYHEDYELEMTPSEVSYHEMLKWRAQLIEIAHNLRAVLFSCQKELHISDKNLDQLLKCEIVEDELVFIYNPSDSLYFEHSTNCSTNENFSKFHECVVDHIWNIVSTLISHYREHKANVLNSYLHNLIDTYTNYLEIYDAI